MRVGKRGSEPGRGAEPILTAPRFPFALLERGRSEWSRLLGTAGRTEGEKSLSPQSSLRSAPYELGSLEQDGASVTDDVGKPDVLPAVCVLGPNPGLGLWWTQRGQKFLQ